MGMEKNTSSTLRNSQPALISGKCASCSGSNWCTWNGMAECQMLYPLARFLVAERGRTKWQGQPS